MTEKTPENQELPLSALTFDVTRYDKYLADCDLTKEQKQKFLETLWNIIVSFVDIGFGIDATQAACGQLLQTAFKDILNDSDMIKSKTLPKNFKNTAASKKDSVTKGVKK